MSPQILSWPHTKPVPPLALNSVHVWAWDLDRPPLDSDWAVLSEEETLRARRFVYPRDRDRYVCAHAAMRILLSGYIGIDAAKLIFSMLAYGKPRMERDSDTQAIHFNLTHSGNIAALAVSRDYDLGVDLEHVQPIDPEIANDHFSPSELLTLNSLPPDLWLAGFYRCWTSKESLLKGEGMGLNLPLDGFDVEVHPQRPPALIAVAPQTDISLAWHLVELKPADDFVGTLAVHDPEKTFQRTSLQCFSLSR
ncbi:MAG TPA: 4'-phosphopantetheinyl transferase superfamily protein [Acidobacteriaceae bacterium]|nr:4'-phosphopantetheinyl transferase superfamily protein [Acidobacteriaceae bacterium]